ncbi:hypothetical protein IE53DRAFT_386721 [Violaceomyces palustris]|uniref:Uncharacterized protein n=1 Tax=Violaceomyces palustris TaxID=1673888 RepID=A0ACD0NYP1_9BASI|nr:hypothetical protein IE53DRAFT_386721 [Violaceomyces palustris]
MRINRNTVLVGSKVVLVPYRLVVRHLHPFNPFTVERYHEWMKDSEIQQMTASEPLSLEEEYEMQRSWQVDEDKLTFIVFARKENEISPPAVPESAEEALEGSQMIGDVNIFFNKAGEEEEEEGQGASTEEPSLSERLDAECEVMIAEATYRRKGLARQALEVLIQYVTDDPTPSPSVQPDSACSEDEEVPSPPIGRRQALLPIPSDWLTCKISLANKASINLFTSLGFEKSKVSEVWKEVEMRRRAGGVQRDIKAVLYWKSQPETGR